MAGGRPTKYTPARREQICEMLRLGATRVAAHLSAGVGSSTFFTWLDTYPEFREAVTRAEAEAEAACAAVIVLAAKDGDWRAAEAWLKRRRKEEWSEKIQQEHSGQVTIDAVLNALPDEFREEVRRELDSLVRTGAGVSSNGNGKH